MISKQRSVGGSGSLPAAGIFLTISVTDPVKLGNGVQSYISYRVITKTNMPEYQGPEKIVIRRYSDFVWLHERLASKYKGIFIPPLPEKNAVEKFRFTAEFIELRRRGLDVFINRIASHTELRYSEDLRDFLQADEDAMEHFRSMETSIFGRKSSDFMQLFKDVQSKVSDVVMGKEKPVEESDPEYEKFKQYIIELEEHLMEVQKQAFRLVKRHKEMGNSLVEFGKVIKLLGACEGGSLGKSFSDLGSQSEILSLKLQKEAHELLMNVEEPLKDYVRTVQSIKATMADRAQAFKQQCEFTESAKLKEINVERLKATRQEHKVPEAEADYKEAHAQAEEATKLMQAIARRMQQEAERFQEEKTLDLGLIIHNLAKGQAQLAKDIAEAWRSLLPKLENCS